MSLEESREQLVEQFGVLFDEMGQPPMQGRVLGFLMLSYAEHVSTQELKGALRASAGSISSATRALSAAGFMRRVFERGSRSHHFRAEEDVWGDRKSTRLNSSHVAISYAVFCLKKKRYQKQLLLRTLIN